jgi:hypothetical protein
MSRAINRNNLRALLSFIMGLLFHGCLLHPIAGPGYVIDIRVVSSAVVDRGHMKHLEAVAATEKFVGKRISLSGRRTCLYFGRDLDEPQFRQLDYKFIQLGYCYDIDNITNGDEGLRNVRVFIDNDWQGQASIIKQEIDRLGNVFYQELANLVGKENVIIERRRTGPPF